MKRFVVALLLVPFITHTYVDITVQSAEGAGFFAELHKVMQNIMYWEKEGIVRVQPLWNDVFFPYKNSDSPDENGWDLFFEPIKAPCTKGDELEEIKKIYDVSGGHHEMHDQICAVPWIKYDQYLPYRQYVHEKLKKYVQIKPHILDQMDAFYDKHLKGHVCIGVHARMARAHRGLIPGYRSPTLEEYYDEVERLIKEHSGKPIKIFVASDNHDAVGAFKERFGDRVTYISAFRVWNGDDPCFIYTKGGYLRNNLDVWHKIKQKSFGGVTTLLDCLLLSRCDYLVHTTSNLAFFATYFNPEIKATFLPRNAPMVDCRFKQKDSIRNPLLNPTA